MNNRSRTAWVYVCAIAFAAVLVTAIASAQQKESTRLTFDRTVLLPTGTLPAGTYTFERQGDRAAAPVVIVFDVKGTRVATNVTRPITRADRGDSVVFELQAAGATNRIVAWYSDGGRQGYQFIYR
jgi:hypothetical protein